MHRVLCLFFGLLFLLSTGTRPAEARTRYSLEGQIGATHTTRDLSGLPAEAPVEEGSGSGFAFGGMVWMHLAAPVDIGVGGVALTKSYEYEFYEGTSFIQYELNDPYLSVPLVARVLGLQGHVYAIGGFTVDFLLASTGPEKSGVVPGFTLGLGARWSRLTAEWRYHRDIGNSLESEIGDIVVSEKFTTQYFLIGVRILGGR